jgi:hypothetical protein
VIVSQKSLSDLDLARMPERADLMIDPASGPQPDQQRGKMDIKVLQKSNTFSSLSTGSQKLGSWFDRRARKLSMKCSKSITLGERRWGTNPIKAATLKAKSFLGMIVILSSDAVRRSNVVLMAL